MNPLLKDRRALGLYLLICILMGALLAAVLVLRSLAPWGEALAFSLPLMVLFGFMSLSAWYLCKAFPLQKTPLGKLLTVLVVSSAASSVLWTLLGLGWSSLLIRLLPGFPADGWPSQEKLLLAATGAVLFLVATLVHYLVATFAAARAAERTSLELEVLARQAELKALRTQIDPHFLFNSLNSISALTTRDPAAARAMTLKLAEFLRCCLDYGALDRITLEQELSLALRYLDIEKIRFGSRLEVESSIQEEARSCLVPPLLLQPLVENAVRHGVAQLLEGGKVAVHARREGPGLVLEVRNPFEPEAKGSKGNGVGLENVRQRIRKTYGHDARLDVRREGGSYLVTLRLPALAEAAASSFRVKADLPQ